MATETFRLQPKASISLGVQAARSPRTRARLTASRSSGLTAVPDDQGRPTTAALVETRDVGAVVDRLGGAGVEVEQLSPSIVSVQADASVLVGLSALREVRRVQSKKLAQPHLDLALPDIGLRVDQAGANISYVVRPSRMAVAAPVTEARVSPIAGSKPNSKVQAGFS